MDDNFKLPAAGAGVPIWGHQVSCVLCHRITSCALRIGDERAPVGASCLDEVQRRSGVRPH